MKSPQEEVEDILSLKIKLSDDMREALHRMTPEERDGFWEEVLRMKHDYSKYVENWLGIMGEEG